MKKLFLFVFYISYSCLFAQQITEEIIPLSYYTSNPGSTSNKPSGSTSSSGVVPTISAEMEVNSMGALTYTIPIEVFKGLNGFQPNAALSYNSQSGNGQAGWGWNIVGLSLITQGGTSKEIDGITRGAQLNGSDPFYLDGQRLIKINETTYETQVFSKLKISKGTESGYSFIVQYPDGKIGKYKELAYGQHYICTFIDALEYEIHYEYTKESGITYIKSISYGGKTVSADTYKIEFIFKKRKYPVGFYKNGESFTNANILSQIKVSSTYDGIYRKYTLYHELLSNEQEQLGTVEVENGKGEKLKPLKFTYNTTQTTEIKKRTSPNKGLSDNVRSLGSIATGDFYGKGKTYPIFVEKTASGYKILDSEKKTYINLVSDGDTQLFAGKTLINNTVTENDQLIALNTAYSGEYDRYNNAYYIPKIKATISIKDLVTGQVKNFSFKALGNYFGSDLRNCTLYNKTTGEIECIGNNKSKDIGAHNVVVTDLNNDGLTDMLIRNTPEACLKKDGGSRYTVVKNIDVEPHTIWDELTNPCFERPSTFYFIELGKLSTEGEINPVVFTSESDHLGTPIEFDGDGIPELIFTTNDQFSYERAKYPVMEVLKVNTVDKTLKKAYATDINSYYDRPAFYGDFNGDGLTDFITPHNVYNLDRGAGEIWARMAQESQTWYLHTNKGNGFTRTSLDLTKEKITYLKPSQKDVISTKRRSDWEKFWSGKGDEQKYEHTEYGTSFVIPTDFDNDGKTDLIFIRKFAKFRMGNSYLNSFSLENLLNGRGANEVSLLKATPQTNGSIKFVKLNTGDKLFLDDIKFSPISLLMGNTDYNQLNTYRSGVTVYDPITGINTEIEISNDHFTETYLKAVDNGSGVVQTIEYRPMEKNKNTPQDRVYTATKSGLSYPYYVHQNQGNLYLAYKLNTLFDGKAITSEYRYENGIQHLEGKGYLGFQKTFVSDPYESELRDGGYYKKDFSSPVFWKINTFDPKLDNSPIKTTYGSLDENSVFTESALTYTRYDKGNHKYLILTASETSKDYLKKVNSAKTYTYDPTTLYLKEAKTTVDDGFSTSQTSRFTYKADFTKGKHYFSGKIEKVEEILSRSGATFTTKQESVYNASGQLTQSKKYGNNTGAVVTDYTYDAYGNILTEKVSSGSLSPLTTQYEYDATHRYVVKTTSPEGLKATQTINTLGQLISETSALGLTTTYTYDSWNNLTESKDHLGIKTTVTKAALSDGKYRITTQTQGMAPVTEVFDKFDRKIQTQTLSLGKTVYADTEYDIFGKVIRTSEPYFEGGNKLWNTTEYDELNRPVKQTAFTGKVITTCYEGLKVTVQDGHKKISKTLDASGHVIEHNDGGGKIKYTYYPNGALKEANYDGIVIKTEQDGWGNKTKMTDPSAGTYQYAYDNFGRLTQETTPKGVTTYTYDTYGKLITEVSEGNGISISKAYTYNSLSLPTQVSGYSNGSYYNYETFYDNYYRIKGKKETTPYLASESTTTYDSQGRPDQTTLKTTVKEISYTTTSKVKNQYNGYGELVKLLDSDTGGTIWELQNLNSQGQITRLKYGNGYTLDNTYGSTFYLQNISHKNGNKTAVNISYDYDEVKGVLKSRNNHNFGKNEAFTYDQLDRLLTERVNNVLLNEYTYDKRGRITYNSNVGAYEYPADSYRLDKLTFNNQGNQLKQNRGFHQITYTMFKTPTEIYLPGKDRIAFEYGILRNRSAMYYGDTGTNIQTKPKRKYYTSDGSVEVIKEGNKYKISTYIDGDAYSAHYLKIEKLTGTTLTESKKYYLHRDNLQSIVAITNAADGAIAEQRFFDAWGNLTEVIDAAGKKTTLGHTSTYSLLTDRGYTGHEHLLSVGLINMNGRIYDPALRRFLEPDNFVQDPFNTQNFNRYGYVTNNPLLYIDPSGEFGIITAIIIGAAVALVSNAINNIINGVPFWYGMGKAVVVGAVSGAISFGIGDAVSGITNGILKALAQAGMHGMSEGLMNSIEGGSFMAGFASGAMSSLVSSGIGALGTNYSGAGAYQDANGNYGPNKFGASNYFKAVSIASGGLSGGISSVIAGGNFWKGVRQGVIVAGLNHLAHGIRNKISLWNDIKDAKINPSEKPKYSKESIIELLVKV
ncbi:MAG: hypothetical protein LBP34_00305, partial [Flavobacteriaceae bacterium]|nr:hypothetical protein [Flavobacteriaceae bacterium]